MVDLQHHNPQTRNSNPCARDEESVVRFLANMANIRQSRPDSGLGYKVKDLKTFEVVPSLLGSGWKVCLT